MNFPDTEEQEREGGKAESQEPSARESTPLSILAPYSSSSFSRDRDRI